MMKVTFTNEKPTVLNYDLEGAQKTLLAGGLVLLPTDTVWCVACIPNSSNIIDQLIEAKRQKDATNFELVVNSIEMLRNYAGYLHPRLETLLAFHTRPLTIVFDHSPILPTNAVPVGGQLAIRLAHDEFCKALIHAVNEPLLMGTANVEGMDYPVNFGSISSEILQKVDYVVKYRQGDKSIDELSVMVKLLEDQEELEFIRE